MGSEKKVGGKFATEVANAYVVAVGKTERTTTSRETWAWMRG